MHVDVGDRAYAPGMQPQVAVRRWARTSSDAGWFAETILESRSDHFDDPGLDFTQGTTVWFYRYQICNQFAGDAAPDQHCTWTQAVTMPHVPTQTPNVYSAVLGSGGAITLKWTDDRPPYGGSYQVISRVPRDGIGGALRGWWYLPGADKLQEGPDTITDAHPAWMTVTPVVNKGGGNGCVGPACPRPAPPAPVTFAEYRVCASGDWQQDPVGMHCSDPVTVSQLQLNHLPVPLILQNPSSTPQPIVIRPGLLFPGH